MGPRWKLTVEGLGKIERAEVDVRPLMLFVGENNTGKSYLASLLWGLFTSTDALLNPAAMTSPSWIACVDWLQKRLEERAGAKSPYRITEEDRGLFVGAFNDLLAAGKDAFVRQVFNSDLFSVGRLRVDVSPSAQPVFLSTNAADGLGVDDAVGVNVSVSGTMLSSVVSIYDKDKALSKSRIVPDLLSATVFGSPTVWIGRGEDLHFHDDPIFLPASRTGFMLLYKALVRRQVRQLKIVERNRGDRFDLTSPAVQFADLLALHMKNERGGFVEEADLLEKGLDGRVELIAGAVGVNEYVYHPSGAGSPLTMAMSSSLVTELAPIILVLRHMAGFPVLILEEPEAHLHPKLQRKLAQVIVRLIRKGLYVWITTHSENFCQQINNFMKIGALDPTRRAEAQQKLGYGEQDYLLLDDVTGYQFKLDEAGERSTVTELKRTERGMAMPTFNKELIELAKEIDYLDERAAEEEGQEG